MAERVSPVSTPVAPAPTERGWGKLLIALVAFLLLPRIPQLQALFPIEQTTDLLVPAMAACALVGWWAGGRAFLAIAWVAIATLLVVQANTAAERVQQSGARLELCCSPARSGSSVCSATTRPLFTRALATLGITLVSGDGHEPRRSGVDFAGIEDRCRRARPTQCGIDDDVQRGDPDPPEGVGGSRREGSRSSPKRRRRRRSSWRRRRTSARSFFRRCWRCNRSPRWRIAWATYHRLARARLGPPLRPLRDFRFNDQLVWGLIVGLTIVLLPTLKTLHGVGKNLLVFFGALYAVRGFGVLTWFMAPGSLGVTLAVSFVLLFAPVLGAFAALALMMLGVAALALGLGDTWADWRSRARSTS